VDVCAFALPHGFAEVRVDAKRNIYRKPVLVMITYFNAAVGAMVDQIVVLLHLEEFIGKLGEFYVDGKAHFGVETKIDLIPQLPYLQFSDLALSGSLGIEGGYRMDIKAVGVKVWAGADGSIKFIRMGPVTWPPINNWEFDSITLKGEVGARFRAGWFQREAKGPITWTYSPTAQEASASLHGLTASDWHLIGHSRSPTYATFQASPTIRQSFARPETRLRPTPLTARTTVTSVLVGDVYTYPEPSLAVNPATDESLLLWTHDDPAKPVGQAHEIYFSHWDGASWSPPAGVTNDHVLDADPQVAWAADGEAVALWSRLPEPQPITATWEVTTARKVEIATAVYTHGAWSAVSLLSNNTALDFTPQLARNGTGKLLAVWRQNEAGLLGGDEEHPDRILATFYDGDWGAPTVAVDGIPGLVDLAVGYGNGQALIAFTRYLTPTGSTTPTLQLFTSVWDGATWSAPTQLTDDALGHHDPQVVYDGANHPLLVWIAGDELRLRNLDTGEMVTLALEDGKAIDEFRIVRDGAGNIAAVFTAQEGQRDLYLAFYDAAHKVWGRPLPLTDDRAAEASPSAGLDSAGRLLMAYAATTMHSVTRTTTLTDTGETITFTLPVEGQTDLFTLSHTFGRNLTAESLAVSADHPSSGETVVLTATVRNSGDEALDGVKVAFYDGDPNAGGTLIATATWPTPLAGGFTATLTTTYAVPAAGGVRILYAVADPDDTIAEFDETDNRATLSTFGPDLALAGAAADYWGGQEVGLRTLLRNLGTTTAPTTTVAFYRDNVGGTLVVTDTVPALAAGEAVTLTTPWDFGSLGEGTYRLVAEVNGGDFTEVITANNRLTFTLDVRPDLMVSPYYLWTTSPTGTRVLVTATVYNVGSVAARNVEVGFYGDDRLDEKEPLFTRTIAVLEPGRAATLTGEVAGPLECTLYAYVDPTHAIIETTRANNLAGIAYRGMCHTVYLPLVLKGVKQHSSSEHHPTNRHRAAR